MISGQNKYHKSYEYGERKSKFKKYMDWLNKII